MLDEELRMSKQILQDGLGSAVGDFAYPFGKTSDCGTTSGDFLLRCGYRSAVTTTAGTNMVDANLMALRRLQSAMIHRYRRLHSPSADLFLGAGAETSINPVHAFSRATPKVEAN